MARGEGGGFGLEDGWVGRESSVLGLLCVRPGSLPESEEEKGEGRDRGRMALDRRPGAPLGSLNPRVVGDPHCVEGGTASGCGEARCQHTRDAVWLRCRAAETLSCEVAVVF